MSSTYNILPKPWASIISSREAVYKVRDNGPMTDPWGTPSSVTSGFDREAFIYNNRLSTICKICFKPIKAELETPYLWHKRSRITFWLILSKAAEKI